MRLAQFFFLILFSFRLYSDDLSLILDELEHSIDTEDVKPLKKKSIPKKKQKKNISIKKKKISFKNINHLFFDKKPLVINNRKKYKKSFAVLLDAGILLSKEKYLSKTFIADINANGGDLATVSSYKKLGFSSYYNFIKFFNPYFSFSYIFSGRKETVTPIYYGLDTLNTLLAYRLFSFNFLFGSKFDIISFNKFLFSFVPLLGFAINKGSILMELQEHGSLSISDSYLYFGGLSLSGSFDVQTRFIISKKMALGLNISYLYLVLKNVRVTNSEGLFYKTYPKDSFLAIYNSETKATEPFYLNLSGLNIALFFEFKF